MLRRLVIAAEVAAILVVLAIAAAVWIVLHAVAASGHLEDLRADVDRVRADLVAGRDARTDLAATQRDARAADNDTHDPVWFVASWLPPVHTVRGLASVADDLAQHALPPVVQVGSTVSPSRLRVAHNQIALAPLQRAAPVLARADVATAAASAKVAALPDGWIGAITSAKDKVATQLASLSGSVDDAARFAKIGPAMLGADGPRRYFVGIQNNAEARATGGLVAAYAIVVADHGKIHVAQRGNDGQLHDASRPVLSMPADYDRVYGNYLPAQRWPTSNVSPDFPSAATIWAHLWQAQSGQHIDGAFGVDPVALSSLLSVVGPVTVPGSPRQYTGADLTSFIESTEYRLFTGADQSQRKDFVSKVAGAVLHRLLSGAGDPAAIATALGRSAGTGHLALWSSQPDEQQVISDTPLAGALAVTRGPYLSVSVDNATGTKLDYYLDRTVRYAAGACDGTRRETTVTVRLLNAAPPTGLPPYVLLRGDRGNGLTPERVAQNRVFAFIHVTQGSYLTDATLDGRPVQVSPGVERGHPVYRFDVVLDPGVPRTIRLRLSEPVAPGRAQVKVQPLARPQQTMVTVPSCA